jgi:hypothetical protein
MCGELASPPESRSPDCFAEMQYQSFAGVDADMGSKCVVRAIEQQKIERCPRRNFEGMQIIFPQFS